MKCQQCGREFYDFWTTSQKYCSGRCARDAQMARRKEKERLKKEQAKAELPAEELPTKRCLRCGAGFVPSRDDQLFCSVDCQRAAKKEGMAICEECGRVFTRKRTPKGNFAAQKLCSEYCRKEHARKTQGKWKKGLLKTCAWCGKEFPAAREVTRYCSQRCHRLGIAKKTWERHHPGEECHPVVKTCIVCGKEFFAAHGGGDDFCSARCRKVGIDCRPVHEEVREEAREEVREEAESPKEPQPCSFCGHYRRYWTGTMHCVLNGRENPTPCGSFTGFGTVNRLEQPEE